MTLRYADRVVMLTGAGQGLGRAMAERFAREGATLAVCDLNRSSLDETLSSCNATTAVGTVVDVADSGSVRCWVDDTLARFGRIDVLINNAGVARDSRIEHMTDVSWHSVLAVSLDGAFHCCRAVLDHMKQRRYGRILSLGSIASRGQFGSANYAAAKAGIVGLARTVALEGAQHGVTCNVISPGAIDTPLLASLTPAVRDRFLSRIPLKRFGEAHEIAEAAAFVCSEEAGYITGVVLDIDGGISIGDALT
jgi:3-oxoacyl-[acyl-carrier protein] reductase